MDLEGFSDIDIESGEYLVLDGTGEGTRCSAGTLGAPNEP